MTKAVPVATPRSALRARPLQAALSLGGLCASVAVTAVLVATPASSRPAQPPLPPPTLPEDVRVEVRGADATAARSVADRLSGSAGRLVRVAPAEPGPAAPAETEIVYHDRRSMEAARQVRDMLGRGTLRRQQVFAPAVDVTIVLGKDLQHR